MINNEIFLYLLIIKNNLVDFIKSHKFHFLGFNFVPYNLFVLFIRFFYIPEIDLPKMVYKD